MVMEPNMSANNLSNLFVLFFCLQLCVGSGNALDSPVSTPKMSQTLETWFLLILLRLFFKVHEMLKYYSFNLPRPELLFWMHFEFLVFIWDQLDLIRLKN